MIRARTVHNVLARTIGHKGIIAPKEAWDFGVHHNPLFTVAVDQDNGMALFGTQPYLSPHLLLAHKYLKDGVTMEIPLTETADGRLELDMRKGNLPARWATMLYDFEFNLNGTADKSGVELESYIDEEFEKLITDLNLVFYHDSHPYPQFIDAMNKKSMVSVAPELKDPDADLQLNDFVCHYKNLSGYNIDIHHGPECPDEKLLAMGKEERKWRMGNAVCGDGSIAARTHWAASNRFATPSTKHFVDECVSMSNGDKSYHCDIGCTEGSFGFPLSPYFLAMRMLFGDRCGWMYIGEFDQETDFHVHDDYQYEELVVLQQNIIKYGGSATMNISPHAVGVPKGWEDVCEEISPLIYW